MKWNYRIIKEKIKGEYLYYVAEVFYEDDVIKGWTEPIFGYYESPKELKDDLKLMLSDSKQDVIEVFGEFIVKE